MTHADDMIDTYLDNILLESDKSALIDRIAELEKELAKSKERERIRHDRAVKVIRWYKQRLLENQIGEQELEDVLEQAYHNGREEMEQILLMEMGCGHPLAVSEETAGGPCQWCESLKQERVKDSNSGNRTEIKGEIIEYAYYGTGIPNARNITEIKIIAEGKIWEIIPGGPYRIILEPEEK